MLSHHVVFEHPYQQVNCRSSDDFHPEKEMGNTFSIFIVFAQCLFKQKCFGAYL